MPQNCPSNVTLEFPNSPGNTYTFQFNGVTSLGGGLYRWCYTVSQSLLPGSGRGLSHFILEFCPDITEDNIVEVTLDGVPLSNEEPDPDYTFGNIPIFPPNQTPFIYGIKFDQVGDLPSVLCFTLNVNVEPVAGDLSIKVGGGPNTPDNVLTETNAICTPGCDTPPPPPGRGVYCSI
jgi:hypothetical protein